MAVVMAQGGTAEKIADPSTDSGTTIDKKVAPYSIRLHLVRHGETQANVQNIVLGQGDSPLTDDGVAVARLAAASDIINGKSTSYWRCYCSDLYRAHRTAKIVLGLGDGRGSGNDIDCPGVDLIVDSRLRELAKGAREGFPKKLSYEEAMAARRRDVGLSENDDGEVVVPRLESLDEAWVRAKDWIDSLVKDASEDYYLSRDAKASDADESESGAEVDPKVYDVFALSHSALIRTMIHKMVDAELPTDYATTREGSLSIPNLSRTIIDIRPEPGSHIHGTAGKPRWKPSLVRLTDTSHLQKTTPDGPPYL